MNEQEYSDSDLALASERFELVAKATYDAIWDWDLVKNTVWWNNGMEFIFGYKEEDLESGPESWYTRIHPDDKESVLNKIQEVIKRGEVNWSDTYRTIMVTSPQKVNLAKELHSSYIFLWRNKILMMVKYT